MWAVVLDSTVLVGDYRLRSPAIAGLFERARGGQLRIAVPEVCIREAIGCFQHELVAAVDNLRKEQTKLLRLNSEYRLPNFDVSTETAKYGRFLREALTVVGAHIRPVPQADHLELVDRAITRTKPFNDKGAGYRDTLVWLTVLEEAASSGVVLVTNNHYDFAESPDAVSLVAKALRVDLMRIGEEEDRVLVCRDPQAAVEHLFVRDERLFDRLRAEPPISATDLLDALDPLIPVPSRLALQLPEAAHLIGITDAEPIAEPVAEDNDEETSTQLEVTSASHIAKHTALVELLVPVVASIEFVLGQTEAAFGGSSFSVLGQWDASRALCVAHRDMDFRFLVTYDVETQTAERAYLGAISLRTGQPGYARQLLKLRPGERVEHRTFGIGTVRGVRGTGTKAEVDIEFQGVGRRRLLVAYAPLRRLEDG